MQTEQKSITYPYILLMLLFPAVYFLRGVLIEKPFHDSEYLFYARWGFIDVLHWLSVLLVIYILKKHKMTLEYIGFNIRDKKNYYLLFLYIFLALCVIGYLYQTFNPDAHELSYYKSHLPVNTTERLYWMVGCFTAGFCEELTYRAYCINALLSKNINIVVTVIVSSVSFTFIHSWAAIYSLPYFLFYFGFGVICSLLYLWKKNLQMIMFVHMTYDFFYMLTI